MMASSQPSSSSSTSYPITFANKRRRVHDRGDVSESSKRCGYGDVYGFKFSHVPPSLAADSNARRAHHGILHCTERDGGDSKEGKSDNSSLWALEYPPRQGHSDNDQTPRPHSSSSSHVFTSNAPTPSNTQDVVLIWDDATQSYILQPLAGTFNMRYDRGLSARGLSQRAQQVRDDARKGEEVPRRKPEPASSQSPATKAATAPASPLPSTSPSPVAPRSLSPQPSSLPPMTAAIPAAALENANEPEPEPEPEPRILDWDEIDMDAGVNAGNTRRDVIDDDEGDAADDDDDDTALSPSSALSSSPQPHQPPAAVAAASAALGLTLDSPAAPRAKAAAKGTQTPTLPSTPGVMSPSSSSLQQPLASSASTPAMQLKRPPAVTRKSTWQPAAQPKESSLSAVSHDVAASTSTSSKRQWHDDDDDDDDDEDEDDSDDSDEEEESEDGQGGGQGGGSAAVGAAAAGDDLDDFARLLEEELAGGG